MNSSDSTYISRRSFLGRMAVATASAMSLPLIGRADSYTAAPAIVKSLGTRLSLRFFSYELKLRHQFTVSSYSRSTTPNVQVEMQCDGITGYGEASMPPYLAKELGTVDSVSAFLAKVGEGIGQFDDPFRLHDILSWVDSIDPHGNSAAKAAVDIALHDIIGKIMGQPWYRILGFDATKAPSTTYTISIDDADTVRKNTLECAERFNILKVKLGRDNDREIIETIRSVTDLPLCVDVNQGWRDREHAIDMSHWLASNDVVMIEQPMPRDMIDDIARVTEASPVPIFADEAVQRLCDVVSLQGIYSGINIKLMKCAGMHEAHEMLTLARALGMKVMIGCMTETSCAVTAAAHLSPAVDFADLDGNLLIANDRFSGVTVSNGCLRLPSTPGLGLTLL